MHQFTNESTNEQPTHKPDGLQNFLADVSNIRVRTAWNLPASLTSFSVIGCSEVVAVALLAAAEDKETYSYGTGSCTVDTALIFGRPACQFIWYPMSSGVVVVVCLSVCDVLYCGETAHPS